MKWIHKGHEFDNIGTKINKAGSVALWGAGDKGRQIYNILKEHIANIIIVDNDPRKNGTIWEGSCISPKQFVEKYCDIPVIISVYEDSTKNEIITQIKKLETDYNVNLLLLDSSRRLLPVYIWYATGKLHINDIIYQITEKCTLNCKFCGLFVPYMKNPRHILFDEIKKDIDQFFSVFDSVGNINLTGGEVFFHADHEQIILYLLNNYKSQILEHISIATNEMIAPSKRFIDIIKKHDIRITISDYTEKLPEKKMHIRETIKKLQKKNVNVTIRKDDFWIDYGYPSIDLIHASAEEMIIKFTKCNQICHLFKNGKYYQCIQSGVASTTGLVPWDEGYNLSEFTKQNKNLLLEIISGYSDKGYVEFCRKCNGLLSINDKFVSVAEQVKFCE